MPQIGHGVTLVGVDHPDFGYTYNLSAGTTKAHVGAAMSLDTSAPNTMEPAADGAIIRGVLFSFEDRKQEGVKVGTVRKKGGFRLKIAAGQTVSLGDSVVGAGNGEVKAAAAPHEHNFVTEVAGGYATVVFN